MAGGRKRKIDDDDEEDGAAAAAPPANKCAFKPKNMPEDINPITFTPYITSVHQPIFPNTIYCFQPITTMNTLTVCVLQLYTFLLTYGFDFSICQRHSLLEKPHLDCLYCIPFPKFTYTFIIKTKYYFMTFPPPSWYQPKVLNFLKTFCCSSYKYMQSKTSCTFEQEQELKSYSLFVNMNFNDGCLKDLSTGKTSYVRNKILGFHSLGGRATLSIDCTLSPQIVLLPQHMFDMMDMACPLVIVNRAPSLKGTCIYVLEALRNDNVNDHTIRINPYICEGLHADQDGDELSIFYLKHPGTNHPSHEMKMAICELKRLSWDGGVRHDIAYRPRYEFTQYHRFILFRYNEFFCKVNKLWASIRAPIAEKCNIVMNLGCSIYVDEVNALIQQLSEFVSKLDIQTASASELLNANGSIRDVVLSGAKGEAIHLETYLRNLYSLNPNRKTDLIANFNKYIQSGSEMSRNGTYQFLFLETVNPLLLLDGHVYFNDVILLRNIVKATCFASFFFNVFATQYIFAYIANTSKIVSDDECLQYIQQLKRRGKKRKNDDGGESSNNGGRGGGDNSEQGHSKKIKKDKPSKAKKCDD